MVSTFDMRFCLRLVFATLLEAGISLGANAATGPAPSNKIAWQPWSKSAFEEARSEHKFVLLDLQAVWCHWCHVMDAQTYSDPQVIALINARYIPLRVDQDSRPDLATRYQDYGWPATVVFAADGSEIVKRQGFLPPRQMASMLQAIIDDPSPGPSVTGPPAVATPDSGGAVTSEQLRQQLRAGYDLKMGSWGVQQKFLNWDNVEYCLVAAQQGDTGAAGMARQTLDAQLQLIDPVWGGVDQYSAGDDWQHPHFEKIMQMQAENTRIYAEAFAQMKNPAYLKAAEGLHRYMRTFLTSPDGVVYTSQDADLVEGEHAAAYFALGDAQRRKLGLPRVDTHIYARENGWFIQALCALSSATGKIGYRDEAVRAAKWIVTGRGLPGGGFRHGDNAAPLALGDTLAMGRALLDLYALTADQRWLDQAEQAAGFIRGNFTGVAARAGGFATGATRDAATGYAPQPDFDENVDLARFANLLFHYTGNAADHEMAATAFRFVSTPAVARARLSSVGGILSAMEELAEDPLHFTIVGHRDDPAAQELFTVANGWPVIYKQVEWVDPRDAAKGAITYPDIPQAAAYLCTASACSPPVFDSASLHALLQRRTKPLRRPTQPATLR